MKFVLTSAVLLAVWLVLSATFSPFYVMVGVVTAVIVAAGFTGWRDTTRFRPLRFVGYLCWLTWQVVKSNLRIARLVLSPGMPIHPTLISQGPGVRGDRALTTLGGGITLTPGTLTVDISDEEMLVHALDRRSAEDVRAGIMAHRIARVFVEPGA